MLFSGVALSPLSFFHYINIPLIISSSSVKMKKKQLEWKIHHGANTTIKGELKAKNKYFFIYGLDHIQYCFQLFSGIFLVFPPKKNYLIWILGHRHCGSERMSQRSFLQDMTYDMGKICQNASYRSSVLTDVRLEH